MKRTINWLAVRNLVVSVSVKRDDIADGHIEQENVRAATLKKLGHGDVMADFVTDDHGGYYAAAIVVSL